MSEATVRMVWLQWAAYRQSTFCALCGEMRVCGRASRRGRWLCCSCFDFTDEADRAFRAMRAR